MFDSAAFDVGFERNGQPVEAPLLSLTGKGGGPGMPPVCSLFISSSRVAVMSPHGLHLLCTAARRGCVTQGSLFWDDARLHTTGVVYAGRWSWVVKPCCRTWC